MSRRVYFWAAFLIVFSLACAITEPPEGFVPIPSPPATAPSVFAEVGEVSVLEPRQTPLLFIDPVLEDLVQNQVSEQNLAVWVQQLDSFGTRHSLSETGSGNFGIGAARQWIFNEFNVVGGGRLVVTYDDFDHVVNGVTTEQRNVVATIPGKRENAGIIVLSGHYDSRTINPNDGNSLAPGANDNASGIAMLLEVARLMSAYDWNQTVMFIAFAAEEQQMGGSRQFVQQSWLDGLTFSANITSDIIGGRPGIPQSIRVFAGEDEFSNQRQLGRFIEYIGSIYTPDFAIDIQNKNDRTTEHGPRYSDHVQFLNIGVAAVRLTESVEDTSVQHTSRDTYDLLDYGYLRQAVQLNLVVAASMAGGLPAPEPPTVAKMADAGTFLLNWPSDPAANGYLVSFRPVGNATYPPMRAVNKENAGNVALTGFDPATTYAVSIAAVDANGRIGYFSNEIIVQP